MYDGAVASPHCAAVHLTEVDSDFECDAFFPELDSAKWRMYASTVPKAEKACGTR